MEDFINEEEEPIMILMSISHGEMLTHINPESGAEEADIIPVEGDVDFHMQVWADPGNVCTYPPAFLEAIKTASRHPLKTTIEGGISNRLFNPTVEFILSEVEARYGTPYREFSDKTNVTSTPHRTQRVLENQFVDKKLSFDFSEEILTYTTPGIHVLYQSPNGLIAQELRGKGIEDLQNVNLLELLSEGMEDLDITWGYIIGVLTRLGYKHIYIVDTTCSVIRDKSGRLTATSSTTSRAIARKLQQISRDTAAHMLSSGEKGGHHNKSKRRTNKRTKRRKNKKTIRIRRKSRKN